MKVFPLSQADVVPAHDARKADGTDLSTFFCAEQGYETPRQRIPAVLDGKPVVLGWRPDEIALWLEGSDHPAWRLPVEMIGFHPPPPVLGIGDKLYVLYHDEAVNGWTLICANAERVLEQIRLFPSDALEDSASTKKVTRFTSELNLGWSTPQPFKSGELAVGPDGSVDGYASVTYYPHERGSYTDPSCTILGDVWFSVHDGKVNYVAANKRWQWATVWLIPSSWGLGPGVAWFDLGETTIHVQLVGNAAGKVGLGRRAQFEIPAPVHREARFAGAVIAPCQSVPGDLLAVIKWDTVASPQKEKLSEPYGFVGKKVWELVTLDIANSILVDRKRLRLGQNIHIGDCEQQASFVADGILYGLWPSGSGFPRDNLLITLELANGSLDACNLKDELGAYWVNYGLASDGHGGVYFIAGRLDGEAVYRACVRAAGKDNLQ